ncbi:ATP-dependent DNA helicase sgs1 [Puccinia graminis f. sp. tritici]|uniref:DNA 3'-5' helicase n=1 Tax=Puccinia graminis f. sp. tritici TaxID=56615 RepID=A0A5B0LPU0_PUCGR|nr:ATP-dependent DNA helicase sgs1 [Puccinia graminis f. sp. tritici]
MLPINIPKKICEYDDDQLKDYIKNESFNRYKQESKPLQVKTVANLVRGRNTFLLAATGFGKSRIPEMYLNLTTRDRKGELLGVVVVLNPLDALGDNQVEEKIAAGYTAINLTQLNFNQQTADEVKNGVYNFVYLSPEIFLNNKAFEEMYLTPIFQQKLVLVVVDEAHMIYSWGLVESGKRHLKTLVRHQDQCAFRPSYGNIGAALLNKNNAPILLMVAIWPI